MTRLALAVGFLAVFGFVAYAIVHLLKDYFQSKKENQKQKPNEQQAD